MKTLYFRSKTIHFETLEVPKRSLGVLGGSWGVLWRPRGAQGERGGTSRGRRGAPWAPWWPQGTIGGAFWAPQGAPGGSDNGSGSSEFPKRLPDLATNIL